MSDIFFELQEHISPVLRSGDLAQCERVVTSRLAGLPHSPFHAILDLRISTDPEAVAGVIDEFVEREASRFTIGAAYAEMNGFDINTDLWFFTLFAYQRYGGHDDYDWLSDWQSEDSGGIVIEGLEDLQAAYASDAFGDKRFVDASSVASLLVVIRFQELIRNAATHMRRLRFPFIATAHDFDFIYEVRRDT
jgi:hypothetical protein